MKLNFRQKAIVAIAMILIVLVLLFPHWVRLSPQGRVLQDMGYSFFSDPPKYYENELTSKWVVIDYTAYWVKIGVIILLAAGALLITRD